MKSLLWKEWQENLKWAALALCVGGGLTWLFMREPPWPASIMNPGFLFVHSLVGAAFGAVLGFLQVWSESGGDRRALLLHRPLGRSQIFLAKASVGLGLYLLALGIPFACAVGWVAAPGHIAAPFRWPLALPGLADILTGVVYYFAGMLLAQREAHWFGSRGLPLVVAIFCSLLVHTLPEFRHALGAIVILGGMMGVAAWGSFLTGGAYATQPRSAKIALGVTFLTGLLFVGVMALLVIGGLLDANVRRWHLIDRQGRVLSARSEGEERSVTDLEGQVPEDLQSKDLDWHSLQEIEVPLAGLGSFPECHSYRFYDRLFMPIPNSSHFTERWIYIFDQGRLLGFNNHSKRLTGSLGPDGFIPADQPSGQRFKGELYYMANYFSAAMTSPDFLPLSESVYAIDFAKRTSQLLFTPAPGQTILRAARREDEKQKLKLTFVLSAPSDLPLSPQAGQKEAVKEAIQAVDETGTPVFGAATAFDPMHYTCQAGRLDSPQRFVVWYHPRPEVAGPMGAVKITLLLLNNFAFQFLPSVWDQNESRPSYVVEYDAGGQEIKRQTIPPLPALEPSNAQALYGLVMPPAGVILYGGASRYYFPLEEGWTHGLTKGQVLAPMALMSLSALACAFFCFLRARRYAFSYARYIGWALCGLMWGPAGLLLMFTLEEWPARIACPKCRKLRVVIRTCCEHCGAPHAAPMTDGTEIFEQTGAAPPGALVAR